MRKTGASYQWFIDERQRAWFKHRLGVQHPIDLNYAIRSISQQDGMEPLVALLDVEEAFPRVKRGALARIKARVGFGSDYQQFSKKFLS